VFSWANSERRAAVTTPWWAYSFGEALRLGVLLHHLIDPFSGSDAEARNTTIETYTQASTV
jgi:hypothetical protein